MFKNGIRPQLNGDNQGQSDGSDSNWPAGDNQGQSGGYDSYGPAPVAADATGANGFSTDAGSSGAGGSNGAGSGAASGSGGSVIG